MLRKIHQFERCWGNKNFTSHLFVIVSNNWLNLLSFVQKVDYITYLTVVDHLFDIPRDRKNTEYKKYLETLLDYLHGYLLRIKPLYNIDQEMETVRKDFEQQWQSGSFPGWQVMLNCTYFTFSSVLTTNLLEFLSTWAQKESGGALMNVGAHLDLSAFSSWEELASLGLDRLKSALLALGLKCGG